jgi:hypothetical protein
MNRPPRRSRASPPAAPRRPPARAASGSCLTPCLFPPRSAPRLPASPSFVAPCLRPSTSFDQAEKRIGNPFWRVRSGLARFAAGRSRPQVEPFRRPTPIPLDPATTSAASVVTNFVTKVLRQRRPSARCLREAGAVGEPVSRSVQSGGSGVASPGIPTRPPEAQAALRARARLVGA